MKSKEIARIPFLTIGILFFLLACSDDDPQPGCYQESGRDIIETINNVVGTVRGPGNRFCSGESFIIEPDVKIEGFPLGSFSPCNMTEEFKVDGGRVIFSGYVYEGINDGNQCADFFEITEIRLSDE